MMVTNTSITPTAITPLVPVFFTLRVDEVSQETNETFSITLTLNPATAFPDSFYPTITVTIVDSDGALNSQFCRYFIVNHYYSCYI